MKQNIFGWAAVIALFLAPVGAAFYGNERPQPFFNETVIIGQDTAQVGELVRLKANGDKIAWKIFPDTQDFQIFGNKGENMVVSFRGNGTYTVVAAVERSGNLAIETLEVSVGGVKPQPIDVVTPDVNIDNEIEAKVATWVRVNKLPADLAQKTAEKFLIVANEIEQGVILTAQGVVARTTNLLNQVDLKAYPEFVKSLQDLLESEAKAGHLSTQKDHAVVWRSISKGLTGN